MWKKKENVKKGCTESFIVWKATRKTLDRKCQTKIVSGVCMCAMLERACISVCVHACTCACTCMLVYLVVYACVNEKRVRDGEYISKKCVSERERQTIFVYVYVCVCERERAR